MVHPDRHIPYPYTFIDQIIKDVKHFNPMRETLEDSLNQDFEASITILSINSITLVLLACLTRKIFKLTKFENKRLILLMLSMNLTLVCDIAFHAFLIYSKSKELARQNYENPDSGIAWGIFVGLPIFF